MNTTIELTQLEKEVLIGINNSEYSDALGSPIWSWSIECASAGTKQISGVVSSLSKKGLTISQGSGKDQTVMLTPLGISICGKYDLLGQHK